jgi:hypothetical protein
MCERVSESERERERERERCGPDVEKSVYDFRMRCYAAKPGTGEFATFFSSKRTENCGIKCQTW